MLKNVIYTRSRCVKRHFKGLLVATSRSPRCAHSSVSRIEPRYDTVGEFMKTAILGGSSVGRARVSEVLSNLPTVSAPFTLFNERHSPRIYFSFLHRFGKGNACETGSRISRRSFVLGSASWWSCSCKLVIQASTSQSPRSSNYYFRQATSNDSVVASGDITDNRYYLEPLRSPCSHDCRVCSHRSFLANPDELLVHWQRTLTLQPELIYQVCQRGSIFYQVLFQDLNNWNILSAPFKGTFRTAPQPGHDIRFTWEGQPVKDGY